jgi:argininosuccinate synthase
MSRRILVPFSGSPASAAAIPAMARQHDAEVVALVLDLGQGQELEHLRDRALGAGAVRVHVLDVREEFARDYAVPSLQAALTAPDSDPLGARLAAGLVAKKMAEIADIEDATVVLDRADDSSTLWGRTGACVWTRPASDAPDSAAEVEIAFDRGVPSAINGVPMIPTELIEILNIIAGHHGVGRIDLPDARGEAPAAVVLRAAYRALHDAAISKDKGGADPERVHGAVRVALLKGEHTVVECHLQQTVSHQTVSQP